MSLMVMYNNAVHCNTAAVSTLSVAVQHTSIDIIVYDLAHSLAL